MTESVLEIESRVRDWKVVLDYSRTPGTLEGGHTWTRFYLPVGLPLWKSQWVKCKFLASLESSVMSWERKYKQTTLDKRLSLYLRGSVSIHINFKAVSPCLFLLGLFCSVVWVLNAPSKTHLWKTHSSGWPYREMVDHLRGNAYWMSLGHRGYAIEGDCSIWPIIFLTSICWLNRWHLIRVPKLWADSDWARTSKTGNQIAFPLCKAIVNGIGLQL